MSECRNVLAPTDGRSEGKQNERHDADRFANQINTAKQDVSQSCTGCALGMAEGKVALKARRMSALGDCKEPRVRMPINL